MGLQRRGTSLCSNSSCPTTNIQW